jgi:hypothetical protein
MHPYKKRILVTGATCFVAGMASYHVYIHASSQDLGIAIALFTGGIFFKSAIKDVLG